MNASNFRRRMVKRAVPLAWRALGHAILFRRVATWSVIEQFVGLPDPRESSANLRFHPIALCRTPELARFSLTSQNAKTKGRSPSQPRLASFPLLVYKTLSTFVC